jgi:hypothetical protein
MDSLLVQVVHKTSRCSYSSLGINHVVYCDRIEMQKSGRKDSKRIERGFDRQQNLYLGPGNN